MFETIEEAEETNSICAFCKLPKFTIEGKMISQKFEEPFENPRTTFVYDLIRCTDSRCDMHCKYGHEPIVNEVSYGDQDTVAIVSGWV